MFPFLQKLVANKNQDCIEHKNFVIHALNLLGCDILRKFHHKSSPFEGRSLSRAPTALIPLPFNNRSCPSITDRGLKGQQHQGSDCPYQPLQSPSQDLKLCPSGCARSVISVCLPAVSFPYLHLAMLACTF